MADIFDEVDEILGDVDATTEEVTASEADSNFNESELQDIMAEIESLEKDFEEPVAEAVEETPVKKTQLQEEIERELAMSSEVSEEKKEEIIEAEPQMMDEVESKVLPFESKQETVIPVSTVATESKSASKNSGVSFAANGQMNLNLSFKIGEDTALLTVDPELGLSVSMSGVDICICESVGCKVTMENGVSFTIPLTSQTSTSKKKAA